MGRLLLVREEGDKLLYISGKQEINIFVPYFTKIIQYYLYEMYTLYGKCILLFIIIFDMVLDYFNVIFRLFYNKYMIHQ